MSTAPSGATVARARYWLTALIKALSLGLIAWSGAKLLVFVVGAVISFALEGGAAQILQFLWTECGAHVVWFTLGVICLINCRRISAAVFPIAGAHCAVCGYSRRGLLSTAPCPECGARFGAEAQATPAQPRPRRPGEGG